LALPLIVSSISTPIQSIHSPHLIHNLAYYNVYCRVYVSSFPLFALCRYTTYYTYFSIFPLHCSYLYISCHYENKLTNCQLAPQNSDIIDRQWSITFSLTQFSIDISIHLRGLVASASCVKNCKRTPSPLLASGDDDVS